MDIAAMMHTSSLPHRTPLTDRAKAILSWLDRWLPAQLDRSEKFKYWQARRQLGPPAMGCVRIWDTPVRGLRQPVAGNGDEAHGHTRLEAIVRRVVVPAMDDGRLTDDQARQVQHRLRGDFAHLWRDIETALQRKRGRQRGQ